MWLLTEDTTGLPGLLGFEGSSSVQSIQFVPGKNVQITLKDSKTKESIEKHEYITINDVRCAVVGGPECTHSSLFF